jgi:hypothetical protein
VPRRRPTPWALVIGVVVLAVLATVLAVVLLTRDGDVGTGIGSPSATPSANAPSSGTPVASPAAGSPTASASAGASAGPTPVVAAPDGILPVGSVVEVTVDGLRIREEPSTSSPVLETVASGEVLYLASNPNILGPIEAEGFDWYVVMHAPGWHGWPENPPGYGDGPSADPRISGWVASGSASEVFVSLAPVGCPQGTVDIHTIYAMTPWARLSCFGDRQLTFEGTYGCGGCGGISPGTFTPEWLAHPINFALLQPPYAEGHTTVETLVLHEPPDGAELDGVEAGSVVRVTGHFNDARATECVIAPGEPGSEEPADETAAEWYCRERFVLESLEVLGTDPDFRSS